MTATRRPPSRPVAAERIRHRRTAGDVVAGIAALIALAGLMGGVPYALLRLTGPPVPETLLNGDLLTRQISPSTAVAILVLLVWLAWAQLAVCVIVEVYNGVRRIGMPARVPLSGGAQAVANRLVSAALALFTASAVAIPISGMATAPPVKPPVTVAAQTLPTPEGRIALEEVRQVKKVYVVQPPHGRHHESLWEIADKCLGDGRRYPEIYRLNQHKTQPDGSRLQMASLIRPGWVLDMPDDARGVHVVPADEPREKTLRNHAGKPVELDGRTQYVPGRGVSVESKSGPEKKGTGQEKAGERGGIVMPLPAMPQHTYHLPPAPKPPAVSAIPKAPGVEAPATEAPPARTEAPAARTGPAEAQGTRAGRVEVPEPRHRPDKPVETGGLDLIDYLAGGSLAAAGLLVALGRRRREQLWHRAFGHRITRPRGDAAGAEVALRLGSDAPGSRMLDHGLRMLGKLLAEQGRVPPTIYAVHLSARGLDLWIHPPEPDAPEPFEAHDSGRTWRLLAHEGRAIDEHALLDAAAPYPGLVSLGVTDGGRVLIDLEAAQGVIAVTGHRVRDALAALAVELVTNRWSDQMRVTLVGFGDDLVTIAPHRARAVGSLAEVLPELEARAAEMAAADAQVLTGRVHGGAADPVWPPHFLLSAITPDAGEAERLARLGRAGGRMAAGYVIAGEVPHATWTWEITEDGKARVEALGVTVNAQLLPRRHYDAVIDLFRTAGRLEGEPVREDEGPPREFTTSPSVTIRILGPIEIGPVPPLEEGRAELACEMAVYLAAHPGGVHPVVLGGILWPRGVQAVVRDATIARVTEWLGTDSQGRPNLRTDDTGRLRLGPEVRSDWQLFRELVRRSHDDPSARAVLLEKALGLVRGPLLAARPRSRYAWLAADELEYEVTAGVADAAHRLCEVRLAHNDAEGAVAAVRAGLLLAADDEGLWRDLLRAAHATGDPLKLRAVVDGLHRRASSHPYGGGMSPETEALIDELLPTWRLHSLPSA
ncbi:bacterial transcriptional activator domain-containing protein [Sphaerisporangium sp. B11E5]|uniref:bacterial transcriptional activator domain-containing protein n=1 Tax=Sphaerisporangium sp. B11E5 TaxID=3153563 RepID=UPI00325D60C4